MRLFGRDCRFCATQTVTSRRFHIVLRTASYHVILRMPHIDANLPFPFTLPSTYGEAQKRYIAVAPEPATDQRAKAQKLLQDRRSTDRLGRDEVRSVAEVAVKLQLQFQFRRSNHCVRLISQHENRQTSEQQAVSALLTRFQASKHTVCPHRQLCNHRGAAESHSIAAQSECMNTALHTYCAASVPSLPPYQRTL